MFGANDLQANFSKFRFENSKLNTFQNDQIDQNAQSDQNDQNYSRFFDSERFRKSEVQIQKSRVETPKFSKMSKSSKMIKVIKMIKIIKLFKLFEIFQ